MSGLAGASGRCGGDRQGRGDLGRRRGGAGHQGRGQGRGRGDRRRRGDAEIRARLRAERELPIVWKIARGSIFNKLVILLPAALLLSAFAPWAIAPLLMLGGATCVSRAPRRSGTGCHPPCRHGGGDGEETAGQTTARIWRRRRCKGAIKTDFILSAEIMTIALAALRPTRSCSRPRRWPWWGWDHGRWSTARGADREGRRCGPAHGRRGAHGGRPRAGARHRARDAGVPAHADDRRHAAMLWVGGSIITHALAGMGLGMAIGLVLMPVVNGLLTPALRAVGLASADGGH
jgi:hypothetical protein